MEMDLLLTSGLGAQLEHLLCHGDIVTHALLKSPSPLRKAADIPTSP